MIEDDVKLARLTREYLEQHDVRVSVAHEAAPGIAMVLRERPDVVLLDVMLPGMSGFDVCASLRARVDTPIIMLTARDAEADRVRGLEGGADDYITKPFSSRELLARVRAHTRRVRGRTGPAQHELTASSISIDRRSREATLRGEPLQLTTYEFDLLAILVERAGTALSREQLVDGVRGNAAEAFDRSIDVHISHLRKKLGDDPRRAQLLKTVRGVGYMLVADE